MQHVLTLNSGSSSIKFAVFETAPRLLECVRGQVEGLGATPRLTTAKPGEPHIDQTLSKTQACDHASALAVVLGFLETAIGKIAIEAVGHRIVHGGVDFANPSCLISRSWPILST